MKKWLVAIATSSVALLSACGSGEAEPSIPTLTGADATLIAQVDCGENGVANVKIKYGKINESTLVGRSPITTGLGGGVETYDNRFGISDGYTNLPFSITTAPTTGTCTTTLTNDDTGEVIAKRESAGKVHLEAVMAGE